MRTRSTRRHLISLFGLGWLLVGLLAAPLPAAEPLPAVLILNSYAPGYEWSEDELKGVLQTLRRTYPKIEPMVQHLDFKRFTDRAREPALLEDVLSKCRVLRPQLIITLDNPAFDFALKYRRELGAEIPLVFGGLNRFTPDLIAGHANLTGVSEENDYSGTFQLIHRLRPLTRHILVISCTTRSSQETVKAFAAASAHQTARYHFEYYDRWTNAELLNRVEQLPDDWVGIILDVTRDVTGHYNYNDLAFSRAISTRARVPLFLTSRPPGDNDWSVLAWDGIGGGMVVAEIHGAKVGELAVRILAGEPASQIPIVRHSPQRLEVDYRQMRRFGLPLSLLPPGTAVINQPQRFYRIDRTRVFMAAATFLVLCAAVAVLTLNIFWRRRAEKALRRMQEQLNAAQKLEALGLLAGGVAHDFNNILTVIRGHADLLQLQLPAGAPELEEVRTIQNAVERAAQLTAQLLAVGRKQPLKPEPVDVNQLVQDMVKMMRRVLGETIEVQVVPLRSPCTLVAGKGQLEQVLLNLGVNARDAMPSGGRLTVELDRVTFTPADASTFPELAPGPHLMLAVADTGHGMDRKTISRIFEPFFTTKASGRGTGLGLSVVYGIVRQHGGAIRVSSEVGQGSVFRIFLPLDPPTPPAAAAPEHQPPAP